MVLRWTAAGMLNANAHSDASAASSRFLKIAALHRHAHPNTATDPKPSEQRHNIRWIVTEIPRTP